MNVTDDTWTPPPEVNLAVIAICLFVIVAGVVGNILVILIIGVTPGMQSAVNLCLGSLAVMDTLILVLLPILPAMSTLSADMSVIGRHMCYFLLIIDRGAVTCSVLTFLLITLERYVAICHPLLSSRLLTKTVVVTALAVIWILAGLLSVPYTFIVRYEDISESSTNATSCNYNFERPWMSIYDTVVVATLAFGPVPMLFALYLRMRKALRANIPGRSQLSTQNGRETPGYRLQVTQMLFAVLVIFLICQLPYAVLVMLEYYHPVTFPFSGEQTPTIYAVRWLSHVLFYVNSAINPFIYFSMSSKYRQGLRDLFCRCRQTLLDAGRNLSPATSTDRF